MGAWPYWKSTKLKQTRDTGKQDEEQDHAARGKGRGRFVELKDLPPKDAWNQAGRPVVSVGRSCSLPPLHFAAHGE